VEGRDFQPDEVVENDPETSSPDEACPQRGIVTQALAKALFPDADSFVGKTFYFGMGRRDGRRASSAWSSAAGPAGADRPGASTRDPADAHLAAVVALRGAHRAGPARPVMLRAEEVLRKLRPMPVKMQIRSVVEDRDSRYRNERAMAWMLIAVSVLLLLVTVSGIVGMTALRVAQRRKQIGVRRALGARWRDIVRYFVTENLLITSAGIAAGLLLALALNACCGACSRWASCRPATWRWAPRCSGCWASRRSGARPRAPRNTPPAIATRTA
jgi:putative ABC transport system permease protein